jgi:hypothetical protein
MTSFIIGLAGGYVLSVFTWPKLRQFATGLESEIDALRAKARELEAKIRGK